LEHKNIERKGLSELSDCMYIHFTYKILITSNLHTPQYY